MERIKIDTGIKSYEIEDVTGNVVGVISFNPSDSNIIQKYNDVVSALEDYFNARKENAFTEEEFVAAQNVIVDKLGELIGKDSAKTIFDISGPFSPMQNGALYLENVVNALGGIIEKETKKRMKKVETRMDKYLQGYKKS